MTIENVLEKAAGYLLAVAAILGVGWRMIRQWGDERWPQKSKVFDEKGNLRANYNDDGRPKWATTTDLQGVGVKVERNEKAVLGQIDKSADHEGRLIRLEERDQQVIPRLNATMDRIGERLDEMGERLAEFKDVPRRIGVIEKRLDRWDPRGSE